MPQRTTQFLKDNYYHIYNRGINKNKIFLKEDNYRFLLKQTKKHIVRDQISVIAYCLLPNHYHFLLRQDSITPISKCMQGIFNSYSKAFNRMFSRSGTLFEGRFKSGLVDTDEYLIHLCRYIHRNPIDSNPKLVKRLTDWKYSNYLEWIEIRNGDLVDNKLIRRYFPDSNKYKEFVHEYIPPKNFNKKFRSYLFD